MAATKFSALLIILHFLEFNRTNSSLNSFTTYCQADLEFSNVKLSSNLICDMDYGLKAVVELRGKFKKRLISTGFYKHCLPVSKWSKHGFTCLAVPGHDPPIDITIYLDVAANPGPALTEKTQDLLLETEQNLHTVPAVPRINYNRNELVSLRYSVLSTPDGNNSSFIFG